MLSTDGSPGRLGPAADVPPNDLRQDGVRFCRWSCASRPIGPSGDGVVLRLGGMFLGYLW